MKKLSMILFIAATIMTSCQKESISTANSSTTSSSSSEDNLAIPPQAVSDAFVAKFGNVNVSEWKLRNDGTWRAHFTNNGKAWEATFDSAGNLLKSESA